jgi:RHS repeat-associated protein
MTFTTTGPIEKNRFVWVGAQAKKEVVSKKSYKYYPFGLNTSNSWTRENVTGNNFQYNESTELNPSSGYYDLFFRNFDPALGRFMQVDPLASKYGSYTPYNYGFNDPVYFTDPSGADALKKRQDQATAESDAAFDAMNYAGAFGGGMWGASWNAMTYGSNGGAGGSMYQSSWYGVGSGNGTMAHQQFVYDHGGYGYQINSWDYSVDAGLDADGNKTPTLNVKWVRGSLPGMNRKNNGGGPGDGIATALAGSWAVALLEPTPIGEAIMFAATGATLLVFGPQVIDDLKQLLSERFKGGKQSSRDRDYGLPNELIDWYHNGGGKKQNGGRDIGREPGKVDPDDILEQWEGLGKPSGSKSKGWKHRN